MESQNIFCDKGFLLAERQSLSPYSFKMWHNIPQVQYVFPSSQKSSLNIHKPINTTVAMSSKNTFLSNMSKYTTNFLVLQ